jgi:hypothetical protein
MIRILSGRNLPPFTITRPGAPSGVTGTRSRALSAALAERSAARGRQRVHAPPHAFHDSPGIRPWAATRPYGA